MMSGYCIRNMYRIEYWSKLRKKSASWWSLLRKSKSCFPFSSQPFSSFLFFILVCAARCWQSMTISNVLDSYYAEQEMYQTAYTSLDASAFAGITFSNNSLFMSVIMRTWPCSQFWKCLLFDLSQSGMKLRLPRVEKSAGLRSTLLVTWIFGGKLGKSLRVLWGSKLNLSHYRPRQDSMIFRVTR